MNFYLAPLEGVTGYIFRNAYHEYFCGMDKYYAPFINATEHKDMTSKEINDIIPEHNRNILIVPQLMTNKSFNFNRTVEILNNLGNGNYYKEINLNLGCPSKTVVSKGRGAGFLGKPEELDRFLDEIFEVIKIDISIKTRIGLHDTSEFPNLLKILNKYPVKELIIHPRTQQDFYKNKPRYDAFQYAVEESKNPICYNGDIFSKDDYDSFVKKFPSVENIMLGRGILMNPGLLTEIKYGSLVDAAIYERFLHKIQNDYSSILSGEKNVLYKMKELWVYFIQLFVNAEKYSKKIKKSQNLDEYNQIVKALFENCEMKNTR